MPAVRLFLPAICLTIICASVGRPVMADTIQQCVAEVCKGASPALSFGAFLALEKEDHPGLEELYRRYRVQVDQIRVARERQTREALRILSDTQKVTGSIRQMSDQELMSLFVERQPWNFGTDRISDQYVVVAKPLTADQQQSEVIQQIFARLQSVSSLYSAQLKMDQLNAEPRAALQLSESQRIDSFVLDAVKARIGELPVSVQTQHMRKLEQSLSRLDLFKKQYGDKVYLWLGSLDLELQVLLGRVPFAEGERSVVEKVLIDAIVGVIERSQNGFAQIDKIYSSVEWAKTCRSSYNRALHYGLTQAEKDRLEEQMKPEALRRAQATLQGLFGAHLTSEIMTYVRTLKISGPMSMPEYLQYIERNMKTALAEAQRTDLTLLQHYQLVKDLDNKRDGAIQGFCGTWIFDPTRDSVQANNVLLSTYSAKNYGVGLSISIHEMGHAASIALDLLKRRGVSIAPYEEVRACLSENYITSDRKPIYDYSRFNADKLWTEEDWADSFAGHAMQDMNVNDMCGFVGAIPQVDYVALSDRSGGTHSPTFYRILNIAAHLKNQQPKQCREPLKTQFQGTQFKDCISPFIRNP
jgi:hypothetical protein